MNKFLAMLVCASVLSACGTVGNAVISDDSLKEKAAFALDTTADKVTISNRKGDIDSVKFVATARGRSHQCYITTVAGVLSSDAICSGAGSATGSTNCNALSKAAGRCK
ncbi:hypothetical protein [Kingella negevensis]|uniref:Lipoprotein n=1 Tax=Kingella negevensis TaxID=1522312 RepID=A0A238HHR2_9NEIS|nr:hypothetical protein [Kingella negevensis]MDK4680555.1 hypothetical protein [Kingella negevensis]MDK4681722.1 hypothetical protein [Kingella negevensis]MDK4684719.1 hypothetical protein [Kingella negevensis]MDK4689174.1 hypothetical protein [Kingella negevensis]MDK4689920.1 hypothetical protein [Kingella negevensis]